MYVNKETKFVDMTDPSSNGEVIGFFMDENFRGHMVTSKYGTGYVSFKAARSFLRQRRYGVSGCIQSADNTIYIISEDNPVLMGAFATLLGDKDE